MASSTKVKIMDSMRQYMPCLPIIKLKRLREYMYQLSGEK